MNLGVEGIREFRVLTSSYSPEYGKKAGGAIITVTKSGTNEMRGSWFTLFRDDSLNAKTFSQEIANLDKQDYRRYQFGGSFGGPIAINRAHFFGAFERTQQDTYQVVNTRGLATSEDGTYATPYRETLLNIKVTANLTPMQYMSVRYGRNENSQPYAAASNRPISSPPASTTISRPPRATLTSTRSPSRLPVISRSLPVSFTETGLVPSALAVIFPNTPCVSSSGPAA